MADHLTVQKQSTLPIGPGVSAPSTQVVDGQDGGRRITKLIQKFEEKVQLTKSTTAPKTDKPPQGVGQQRTVKQHAPTVLKQVVHKSNGPETGLKSAPKTSPQELSKTLKYQEYVQKFGSKTANLYQMEDHGVQVPKRSPISSEEVLNHLLAKDKDGVIMKSWSTMQRNGKVDDANLKAITDAIEEIFDDFDFPFTDQQLDWITTTMANKVIIARSTGDEDSADTPNAGGNESVLFVEPTKASVTKAMKEVVLSYFGADSIRNRIVGDGVDKVLSHLPKMPVLLMEMIAEPIKDKSKQDKGDPPPVGIAMSTNKLAFTGGEDFQFISISSAVGPGVNEGNGRVEVDETFVMQSKDGVPLLIYQQPSVKLERIRAVKGEDGSISNQVQTNSTQLAYSPSLSREQVRSLVSSSDKIKSLNGGKTTEVEAVVGGDGKINFVQHRAIPDQRSLVAPTYVDAGKAAGHSQTFQYTTVVPKTGDALVITDWSQVCFAETMKEAEAMFDWKGGSQKVVIVRQPDGSNSHPAVNFGSYKIDVNGAKTPNPIPCLVVPNYSELLALKKTALAPNQPLIVDGQSQKVFVWSDKSFDPKTAILDGRISHHIGLDTSVTDDAILDLVSKLKTTASDKLPALQKDLTQALDKYAAAIKQYDDLLTKNSDTIHNSEGLKCRLKTLEENFKAVKDALSQVVEGNPKYTFDPGTHARLLLVKFFESSMHDIDHFSDLIAAEKSASIYLQALKGAPVEKTVFSDQVNTVKHALTGPLAMRWKRFLTLAEQAGLSDTQISDFKAMMTSLDKMGVTSNWMSTVFEQKYREIMPTDRTTLKPAAPAAKKLLEELVKDFSNTSEFLAQQQTLQKEIGEIERSIADFATPSKFDKAFDKLKAAAKPFVENEWPKDLNSNPLKKAVHIESLGRLIEAFDASIKTLKTSSLETDKLVEKELEMLDVFFALFENLFKIDLPGDSAVPKKKSTYLSELKTAFSRIKSQVKTMDSNSLESQSRCGPNFNVTTSLFSAQGKVQPSNVEEIFTTLHQGLEEIRSGLMVGGSDFDIDMPEGMGSLLAAIPKLAMQTVVKKPGVLVGREITSTGVSYTYNMPVLDHGIKVTASYEKPQTNEAKGKTFIEIDFYASNEGNRLENMAKLAKQFSFGPEPLSDNSRREVVWGEKQLKAKFEVRSETDVKRLTGLINALSAYSIAPRQGYVHNIKLLAETVNKNNDLTTGLYPKKRKQVLNDFLNVTLGGVASSLDDRGKISSTTSNYNVRLVPSKTFSFTNTDDGKAYDLDLEQPKFGLSDTLYAKIPADVLKEAKQEVLQGARSFKFDYQGTTYTIDLRRGDLGLSPDEVKRLPLNAAHLDLLKEELDVAWDGAALHLLNKEGSNEFRSNWPDFIYGTPMAYSKNSKLPELDLWKSVSVKSGRRGDLATVDKALKLVLEKKLAAFKAEKRLDRLGSFASFGDKQALEKAYQEYFTELSKCESICSGYSKKKMDEGKWSNGNAHGRVFDLFMQTRIQRKAVEDQMLILGFKPVELTTRQRSKLPFSDYKLS